MFKALVFNLISGLIGVCIFAVLVLAGYWSIK